MVKITIKKELFEKHKKLKLGMLVVRGIDNTIMADQSYQIACHYIDKKRGEYAQRDIESSSIGIKSWLDAFKSEGIDPNSCMPSHVALLRRVMDMGELPNINLSVNIANAISVANELPVGAHDLGRISGDITIGQNSGKKFTPIESDQAISTDKGEIVYSDDDDVLTRNWVWRQGEKSKITSDSTDIFFPIDALGLEDEQVKEIAIQLYSAIVQLLGDVDATFGVIDSSNNSLDLSDLKKLDGAINLNIETHEIRRDEEIIRKILEKGTEEILPSAEKFEKLLRSGRRVKVYQGFDPTADTLHIGHTVNMRKLEYFRQLGHEVIMLIGDFTARIGDPDKKEARSQLTADEVNENLKLYTEQAKSILKIDDSWNPVKVLFNNDWLGEMKFSDVITLASNFTVQQMLKRELFQRRINEEKPLYVHEFFYPMMQGWDSVIMGVDVEVGGNDQLFNMLAGRELVATHLNKEKYVIAGKLLTTADGKKMGKSEGNAIKLSDSAANIYGKVMSMPDSAIIQGFELLTDSDMERIRDLDSAMSKSDADLIHFKKLLAFEITQTLKGESEAQSAERYFESVYQEKKYDIDIAQIQTDQTVVPVLELITEVAGIASSRAQARRLVEQGAVTINDTKVDSWDQQIEISKEGSVLRIGRNVVRVVKI